MLRIRIDLTAFGAHFKEVFWRFERNGILNKTVKRYATQILQEYGISEVKPVTYLDGTFLPDGESPLILRDGDVLRILPGKSHEKHTVSSAANYIETPSTVIPNRISVNENSSPPHGRAESPELPQDETSEIECAIESTEDTERLDVTDPSVSLGSLPKKRKRGKRQSRTRTKRVSFDVLNDENGSGNTTPQLQSTPFRKRVPDDSPGEIPHCSSVDTRSGAYETAMESMPGVSRQSRMPMKAGSARKEKKLQAGVGYYLGLLSSGDSGLTAGNSADSGVPQANNDLRRNVSGGPSSSGDGRCEDQSPGSASPRLDSGDYESMLPILKPGDKISCDIGMFSFKTASVERYPDVTLEVINNNTEKKSFTVRHIDGTLPDRVEGTEFKVDWGMLTSVTLL